MDRWLDSVSPRPWIHEISKNTTQVSARADQTEPSQLTFADNRLELLFETPVVGATLEVRQTLNNQKNPRVYDEKIIRWSW